VPSLRCGQLFQSPLRLLGQLAPPGALRHLRLLPGLRQSGNRSRHPRQLLGGPGLEPRLDLGTASLSGLPPALQLLQLQLPLLQLRVGGGRRSSELCGHRSSLGRLTRRRWRRSRCSGRGRRCLRRHGPLHLRCQSLLDLGERGLPRLNLRGDLLLGQRLVETRLALFRREQRRLLLADASPEALLLRIMLGTLGLPQGDQLLQFLLDLLRLLLGPDGAALGGVLRRGCVRHLGLQDR